MVYVIPNFDFEARITCNRAEIVERSDGRIESQFVGIHVASGATDNAGERLKVILILKVVVLRYYSASTIEETGVEYSSTQCNVEGKTHKWSSSKVEPGDVCDLTEDRFDFRRTFGTFECAFVVLARRLRDLSIGMISVLRDSKKEKTYNFLRIWFHGCIDLHLHIKAAVASIWVGRNSFTNRGVNESKVRATVVNHIQRASRSCSLSHLFGGLEVKCVAGPCG